MSDKELIEKLGFPQSNKQLIEDYFNITRQAFQTGINKPKEKRRGRPKGAEGDQTYFLDIDRLIQLYKYAQNEGNTEHLNIVEDEICQRHPLVKEIGKETTVLKKVPFTEVWILSQKPLELRIPYFVKNVMSSFLQNEEKTVVYFVSSGAVGRRLLGKIESECSKLANVFIVASPIVEVMPHWSVVIDRQSADEFTLSSYFVPKEPHDVFIPADDEWAISLVERLGRLVKNNRFAWSQPDSSIVSGGGLFTFDLIYPTPEEAFNESYNN